jgi:hypothetical protein
VPGLPQVHQTVYELADLAELDQRAEARGG